jgi:cytochrome c oxidase assembly protein subunit 11
VLAPGERVEMPVTFFVDPEMVDDAEAGGLKSITLSYTMHRADLPEAEVSALAPDTPSAATIR